MKTIREWLQELPDGYRELAMKYENENFDRVVEGLDESLVLGFYWYRTDEGMNFWFWVSSHYESGSPLPPLPEK